MIGGARYKDLKAAQFNTDEYVYRDAPTCESDTAGAFAMWVKLDAVLGASGGQGLIGFGENNAANDSLFSINVRRTAATGTGTYLSAIHRATNGGTNAGYSATTTALSASTWTHLVWQSNGSTWTAYVNGVSQTLTKWIMSGGSNAGAWMGDVSGSDQRVTMGCFYRSNTPASFLNGTMNDVLYLPGRVFTGAEITEAYNSGTPKDPRSFSMASELEVWRMGDRGDNGTTILGRHKGNDMTLLNMDISNYVTP